MIVWIKALILVVIGVGIGVAGVYVGQIDDAPGAAGIGMLVMLGMGYLAFKVLQRRA